LNLLNFVPKCPFATGKKIATLGKFSNAASLMTD